MIKPERRSRLRGTAADHGAPGHIAVT